MRFAPLIPLAILGLGALLLQATQLGQRTRTSKPSLELWQTGIASTFGDAEAQFSAAKVVFDTNSTEAVEVRGQLLVLAHTYQFSADRLYRAALAPDVKLQGNVFISHRDQVLRTEQAMLDPAGTLSGSRVTLENSLHYATAERFILSGDALELVGGVSLFQP